MKAFWSKKDDRVEIRYTMDTDGFLRIVRYFNHGGGLQRMLIEDMEEDPEIRIFVGDLLFIADQLRGDD